MRNLVLHFTILTLAFLGNIMLDYGSQDSTYQPGSIGFHSLFSDDALVREQALYCQDFRSAIALHKITGIIRHDVNDNVRLAAIHSMWYFRNEGLAVQLHLDDIREALLAAIADENPEIRKVAISIYINRSFYIGEPVTELELLFHRETNVNVLRGIIRLVPILHYRGYNNAKAMALEALNCEIFPLKFEAALALAQIGIVNENICSVLIEAVKDIQFRSDAIYGISLSGRAAQEAVPMLASIIDDKPEEGMKIRAIHAIGSTAPSDITILEYLEHIAREDASLEVKVAAISAICEITQYDRYSEYLILEFIKDGSSNLRMDILHIVDNYILNTRYSSARSNISNEVVYALINLMKYDSSDDVRIGSAKTLSFAAEIAPQANEAMIIANADNNPEVRRWARRYVEWSGLYDENVVGSLTCAFALAGSQERVKIIHLIRSLAPSEDLIAKSLLLQALEDEDSNVRIEAIKAVGGIKIYDHGVVKMIMKSINEGNYDVRVEGVKALGALGGDAKISLTLLDEIAANEAGEEVLVNAAKQAIEKITTDLCLLHCCIF